MLTQEQHEQISASLNKMTWAALNKYEALKKQADVLDRRIAVAWGVYLSASEAEQKIWHTPYLAKDDLFGDYVVDLSKPAETVSTETKTPATENEAEALSA